jgi:carbon starvation protein CstA
MIHCYNASAVHQSVTCGLYVLSSAGYSFLLPFTWQTWLMFLIAMLVVVLLLTGMDLVTRKARYAALEKVDSRKVQRSRKRGALLLLLLLLLLPLLLLLRCVACHACCGALAGVCCSLLL